MSVIAVTGVAGSLAQGLLARLEDDAGVERVVGVDLQQTPHGTPKLEYHELDIRDARLAGVLEGVDTIVHLASLDDPRNADEMRSVNVEGARAVARAAAAAQAKSIVALSTGLVYGAHADNPVPMSERASPRPNADYPHAVVRWESEQALTRSADAQGMTVTILRAATVLGRTADNFVSRMLQSPRLMTVKGFEPPLQFVHEDDVADALHWAARGAPAGVYNLACEGWLPSAEIAEITGKRRVELPESVAFAMAERLWRAGLTAAPPGELHYVMHPWVLDTAALRAAGWQARHTNRDALLEAVEAQRSWIALGRARVRKDSLAKGAAATLGAVGAMALVRRARRRSG